MTLPALTSKPLGFTHCIGSRSQGGLAKSCLLLLLVLGGGVGCEKRGDDSIRASFRAFYAPKFSELRKRFNPQEFHALISTPTSSKATAMHGTFSLEHSAYEISVIPLDLRAASSNAIVHQVLKGLDTGTVTGRLFRNDRYDFSMAPDGRLRFIRVAEPGCVRPFLCSAMLPIAAVSLGMSFADILDFRQVEFTYFGPTRSTHFPDAYELAFRVESRFNGERRSGVHRHFFDHSTGLHLGQLTGELEVQPTLLIRCDVQTETGNRSVILCESYNLDYSTGNVVHELRDRIAFVCQPAHQLDLRPIRLSFYGFPEPQTTASVQDSPRGWLVFISIGVALTAVSVYLARRQRTS